MINYKLIVGSNLNQLRKQQNKSQAEVARYLELTVAAYQNYEAGRREANYETLVKLADFYGVTTDYILGRESDSDSLIGTNHTEEDEELIVEKFMTLPPEMRECLFGILVKLGEAAKKRQDKAVQSNAQSKSEIYISKTAARNGEPPGEKIITQEELDEIRSRPDADPDM
ncbi:MAG: helix-turn-helix transcriptional regulator [Ruminococcus flavefaciens]|nr:helix-turn-helix transcriptional regulator [Ruminococcus flavefaciens]MCM1062579.1 helix-turn-helix transcriptional regulator [Eubacterium sp.]